MVAVGLCMSAVPAHAVETANYVASIQRAQGGASLSADLEMRDVAAQGQTLGHRLRLRQNAKVTTIKSSLTQQTGNFYTWTKNDLNAANLSAGLADVEMTTNGTTFQNVGTLTITS